MKPISKIQSEKKEKVSARVEKLDPNNKDLQHTVHLKKKGRKLVGDDGFEHRTSKETTDPILPGKL